MDENTHKELLFIQDARLEDIRELKRYQWQSTYYAILAHGGLIALSHLGSNPHGTPYNLALFAASFCIFVAWVMINRAIERALSRSRQARDAVYELFSQTTQGTRITETVDRAQIYRVLGVIVFGSFILTAIAIFSRS